MLQRAINKYNLQNFIFVIFEYSETEELIFREQFYLDALKPEYNILKVAGSSLGYVHTEESKVKIGETHKGKTGINSPNFGKIISAETKVLMSLALSGKNHPMYNKNHSEESKNKISISNGTSIFVYLSDGKTLINSFSSAIKAGEFLNVSYHTVLKYAKNGKLLKNKWIVTTYLISKE